MSHEVPVGSGAVLSLARPDGNATGLSSLSSELIPKRLQLLKELVPGSTRVAVLWNPANPIAANDWQILRPAPASLSLALDAYEVRNAADQQATYRTIRERRLDALLALSGIILPVAGPNWMLDLAEAERLPVIYPDSAYVEWGGLISFGADFKPLGQRAAWYVDRILRGASPASLPVEQASVFELAINLGAAKSIGLVIPPSVLQRADLVID